ncbi:hypothetical protein Tco_0088894 [Tanacetum coccineum]
MRYSEWLFLKMITDVIYNSEYYQKYLYMAACKPRQATTVTDEEGGKKKKAPPTGKSKKPARAKQPALAKQTKPVGVVAPVGEVAIRKPVSRITRQLPVVEGKGKGIATNEQAAQSLLDLQQPKKKSTTDQYIFKRRTPVTQDASTGPSAQPQMISSRCGPCTPFPADAGNWCVNLKSNTVV